LKNRSNQGGKEGKGGKKLERNRGRGTKRRGERRPQSWGSIKLAFKKKKKRGVRKEWEEETIHRPILRSNREIGSKRKKKIVGERTS